jgi:ABC-type Fe3+ transport system substrate-binding protein
MSIRTTRRQFLYTLALASGGGLLAACSQAVSPASPPTAPPAALKPTAEATTAAPATAPAVVATSVPPALARPGQAVPKGHPTIAALYDAARKEGKFSWWDAHEQAVAQKFIDAFQKQFPGVNGEFFQVTQDVAKARAIQEARAGRVSYDFLDTGPNWTDFVASMIVDSNTNFTDILSLAGVDPNFIVDGTYSPEFIVYGSAYNTDLVREEELPKDLDGFSNPTWKDKLAIETRLRPYIYGTQFLGGEDKVVDMLNRLRANNPRPTDGDVKSQGLLIAGEFPVLIGAYLQRIIAMKGKPWAFVPFNEVWSSVPRQGYIVPNGAPHPNAGKLYLWWFMGPEGQALTDAERFKGNPAPGTGTGPSKYLEEHHMSVQFAPNEYDLNYDHYSTFGPAVLGLRTTRDRSPDVRNAKTSSVALIWSGPCAARARSRAAMNASTSETTMSSFRYRPPCRLTIIWASRPPVAPPISSCSRPRFLPSHVWALSRLSGSRARGAQISARSVSGFTPDHSASRPWCNSGAAATYSRTSTGLLWPIPNRPRADQTDASSQSTTS